MTSETVGLMHWRALDRDGEDKCRLARVNGGYILVGHARFRDAHGWAALDYVLRCDGGWLTRSCDVTGTHGGSELGLRLERDGDGWRLNESEQPQLAGCTDVDLGFTPATNLVPIRRLPEVGSIDTVTARLCLPGPSLERADQRYTRERGGYVHVGNGETTAHLAIDGVGFVTEYPGLWEPAHEL
jgi:hypothetical protein